MGYFGGFDGVRPQSNNNLAPFSSRYADKEPTSLAPPSSLSSIQKAMATNDIIIVEYFGAECETLRGSTRWFFEGQEGAI